MATTKEAEDCATLMTLVIASIGLALWALISNLISKGHTKTTFPTFKIESLSVFVHINNSATARWDLGNVSLDTPWAREDYIESKELECDVTFKGYYDDNNYEITAECKNVRVEIEGGRRGIMIGGTK
ncbi:importin alpha isoform 2, partial [Striga asiatica]